MKLSVFVLSHNKDGYVQEAVDSILSQDYEDYELFIIENSTDAVTRSALWEHLTPHFRELNQPYKIHWIEEEFSAEVRASQYVPCTLLNKWYPEATGDVILFLADDDLFMPGLFRAVADAFVTHPDWKALYYHLARTYAQKPGQGMRWDERFTGIPAEVERGSGLVDCHIDACQIAYRTHVLEDIGQPYFDNDYANARHCDGMHLQKIAQIYPFMPLPFMGIIHRHTPISNWN